MGLVCALNGIWNDSNDKSEANIERFHQSTANYELIHLVRLFFFSLRSEIFVVSRGEISILVRLRITCMR